MKSNDSERVAAPSAVRDPNRKGSNCSIGWQASRCAGLV